MRPLRASSLSSTSSFSSTGNFVVIASDCLKKLKNDAFVGNTSTLVNGIDLLGSESLEGTRVECVFP